MRFEQIRGRHELALPRIESRLLPAAAPLGVCFAVLHRQATGAATVGGRARRLSHQNAELESPGGAPAFANLILRWISGGEELADDLHAKVCESSSNVFHVRFNSVPPSSRVVPRDPEVRGYAVKCRRLPEAS